MDDRRCFDRILLILWAGTPWSEVPKRYGSPTTCWRRLKEWEETGLLLTLWRALLNELNDRQRLRWNECFIDGSFAPAKKGAPKSARPRGGKGTNQHAIDQDGRPLRRDKRRWIVERTIGWLGNFPRLTVRYDRLMATYAGFFHLAYALLVLRKVLK